MCFDVFAGWAARLAGPGAQAARPRRGVSGLYTPGVPVTRNGVVPVLARFLHPYPEGRLSAVILVVTAFCRRDK